LGQRACQSSILGGRIRIPRSFGQAEAVYHRSGILRASFSKLAVSRLSGWAGLPEPARGPLRQTRREPPCWPIGLSNTSPRSVRAPSPAPRCRPWARRGP